MKLRVGLETQDTLHVQKYASSLDTNFLFFLKEILQILVNWQKWLKENDSIYITFSLVIYITTIAAFEILVFDKIL